MVNPARRFLPVAALVVLLLAGFLVANSGILFSLFNPSVALKSLSQQNMLQLGSRDEPLSVEEARSLYIQHKRDDSSRADLALVHQDARNGLPKAFLIQLEGEFLRLDHPENRYARSVLLGLARHRELSVGY